MFQFNFDIESEIAHFRDPSTHAFLNTFLAPPPHTIIGLIGACCGFNQEQTEELTLKIKVGCKILHLKGFLKDLALMENQKNNQSVSIPRKRKFLVGPKYRIFVCSEDQKTLEKIRDAIISPVYTPYLGISDCIGYFRKVSEIGKANKTKFTFTDSVVMIDSDTEFYTKIKDPNEITVYTEKIRSPISFEFDGQKRKPKEFKNFLMSVNCNLHFKKKIDGYKIDGGNVCLI